MVKTFLIAGASSGIGLQLATILIEKGCRVIGISRSPGSLLENPNYTFLQHDFLSDVALPEITEELQGLAYSPGSIKLKGFKQVRAADIQDDFDINVKAAFLFIQKYAPKVGTTETGSIVLFSSVAATTGLPFHTSISISKGAIEALTKSLAAELAPKITVNCIAPSLTETPLAESLLNTDSKKELNRERHPLKRIGNVQDIASMAAFLLTEASWVTGQVIGINGGLGTVLK